MSFRMNPHRVLTVALAATISIGALAGCGSSNDSATKSTDTGSGATTTMADGSSTTGGASQVSAVVDHTCRSWLAADLVATKGPDSGEEGPTPAQVVAFAKTLQPLIAEAVDGAPTTVSGPLSKVKDIVDAAAADATGAAGQALDPSNPDLGNALDQIEKWAYESCGFSRLDTMGKDFSYEGLPASVKSGPVSISFENMSTDETHEMLLLKVADGVSAQAVADALKKDTKAAQQTYQSKVTFMSDVTAKVGETKFATTELSPGQYVVACFVNQGGSDSGKPHTELGMVDTLTVS